MVLSESPGDTILVRNCPASRFSVAKIASTITLVFPILGKC